MSEKRIKQTRECLNLFIRSLSDDSFFNIVRFESNFKALFPEAVNSDEETSKQALVIVQNMKIDFDGTEISGSLSSIFQKRLKSSDVGQLFVISDGKISNTDQVLELTRRNSNCSDFTHCRSIPDA
jgi:hypothetical protein